MSEKLTVDGLFAKAWIELELNLIECAVDTMDQIIEANPKLNRIQQELFENIHKKRLTPYRDVLCMEDNELVQDDQDLPYVEYVQADAFQKLKNCVQHSIHQLDTILIPAINSEAGDEDVEHVKSLIFYFRVKADYYRYIAEYTAPEQDRTPFEESRKAYETAFELAKNRLTGTDPILLGIVLNYSLFIANFMNDEKAAVELAIGARDEYYRANEEREEATSEHDAMEETELLNSIEKNVQMWSRVGDDEKVVEE